ncbi:MAG TPA: hypothetical protein P5318_17085 [Candidatus Hydrogenedentes bacterium]|nr:hypothetical protein [Candidatus Hydrogenedentota bacterium]HRT21831.1 hypothetical protein [Candidatus Hydrogenedentota bacterium]HRT66567.1 hypothetical protein [Candidatus Hydrogenedentota bacterium]
MTGSMTGNDGSSPLHFPWWGRVLRVLLYAGFWTTARIMFCVRVMGRAQLANRPGAVYIALHKRDSDGVVALGTVYWLCRGRGAISRSVVMCGEHVYLPGFIAGYAVRRPRWLSFLLFPVRVGGLMRGMGWLPMALARRRFLMAHLLDAIEDGGNKPLGEILAEDVETVVPGASAQTPIAELLRWPYRDALFTLRETSIFMPDVAERLWERHRARLAECLERFVAVLDSGGCVFMSPEGILSPDGRMGRIRSGLFQLLQGASCDTVMQFIAMTYDFTTTGRPAVFVHVGPPVHGAKAWSQEELSRWVRETARQLTAITVGYLAAVEFRTAARSGNSDISTSELAEHIRHAARRHAADGFTVDPRLLDPRSFQRRWRKFLRYCERRGMLDAEKRHILVREEDFADCGAENRAAASPWQYCLNEVEGLDAS